MKTDLAKINKNYIRLFKIQKKVMLQVTTIKNKTQMHKVSPIIMKIFEIKWMRVENKENLRRSIVYQM